MMQGERMEAVGGGTGEAGSSVFFESRGTFLAADAVFPLFTVGAMLYQRWLFAGEAKGMVAWLTALLWAVPAALSAAGWAVWGWMLAKGGRKTNAWTMCGFAAAGVGYLCWVGPSIGRVTQTLGDGGLGFGWFFTVFLGMLPMVYAGLGRWMEAGMEKGCGRRWWLGTLGVGAGGALALWALLGGRGWYGGGALGIGVYAVGTLAALFGLLRLAHWLGRKRSEGPHREAWRVGEALLFGLALPLGGLALNLEIPFPADFATPWAWGIAVAAGVALLPPIRGGGAGLAVWGLRWAAGAYVLYFFLLFLPLLPLAPLASIWFGAGLLMLAPLLLFQFWRQDVAEGWRTLRREFRAGTLAAVAAAAALALPLVWAAAVEVERADVKALVAWHTGEDFDAPETMPPMGMARARRAMEGVNDYRFGVETPFLTAWRTWRVYGGMHMANPLRQALNRRILGREVKDRRDWAKADRNFVGNELFAASGGRAQREGFRAQPQTDRFSVSRVEGDGTGGYAVGISALGKDAGKWVREEELTLDFRLPAGAWLEGARLKMPDGTWKTARASERKAAEWTYMKIAHVRVQDPLLVTLDTPTTGRLKLFPVPAGGGRELELSVRLPAEGATETVAEFRAVRGKSAGGWVRAAAPEGAGAAAEGMQAAEGAAVTRIGAGWFEAHAGEAVGLEPSEELRTFQADDPDLARRLRRELRGAWRRLEAEGAGAGVPQVRFIATNGAAARAANPSLTEAEKSVLRREFPGLEWLGDSPVDGWFFLEKEGGGKMPVPWRKGQGAVAFARLAGAETAGGAWAAGAKAWETEERAFWHPGEDHRRELLALTRESGALTTQSAYIVLENTVQEKELSLAEKRALGAGKSMDFQEEGPELPAATPEPGTLGVLGLGAGVLGVRILRGRRKEGMV